MEFLHKKRNFPMQNAGDHWDKYEMITSRGCLVVDQALSSN